MRPEVLLEALRKAGATFEDAAPTEKKQPITKADLVLLGLSGSAFTWKMFLSGAFLNAIPGIILQLVLIPAIMVALDRTKLVPFRKAEEQTSARQEKTV